MLFYSNIFEEIDMYLTLLISLGIKEPVDTREVCMPFGEKEAFTSINRIHSEYLTFGHVLV